MVIMHSTHTTAENCDLYEVVIWFDSELSTEIIHGTPIFRICSAVYNSS